MLRSFNELHYAHKVDGDPGATAAAIVKALRLTATIGRHRAAVALIDEHKVACLGDLPVGALPATLAPTAIEAGIVP